jgi:hypothetical protein
MFSMPIQTQYIRVRKNAQSLPEGSRAEPGASLDLFFSSLAAVCHSSSSGEQASQWSSMRF